MAALLKFHFDLDTTTWLAEQLAGLLRTEIPGVMPKAIQSDAVAGLIALLIETPSFTASGMKPPTPAIVVEMCIKLVTVADQVAAMPEGAKQSALNLVVHPANGLGLLKKYCQGKEGSPLAGVPPFLKNMIKLLPKIHDEVNRPSTGKTDRTQFEITADDNAAKESKLAKGKAALDDKENKGKGKGTGAGKGKDKGKAKGKKAARPPAPAPSALAFASPTSAINFQSVLTAISAGSGNAGAGTGTVSAEALMQLVQQQQAIAALQQEKESRKRKRAKDNTSTTAPSQRIRGEGESLNDKSLAASRSGSESDSDSDSD